MSESTMASSLQITDRARTELARMSGDGRVLRMSVAPGGCSGLMYSARMDGSAGAEDRVLFDEDPIRIVAHATSAPLLDGIVVDFSDDLVAPGFRFRNPRAVKSCGCGASFKL
ncbi:MAG: iron-sulfur cluster assembly accessory protein [Verrucomicrobia bacterium]|nr:iron-sulfur cluster assembly accessory protein [Verrucomicrobiota bacterium]